MQTVWFIAVRLSVCIHNLLPLGHIEENEETLPVWTGKAARWIDLSPNLMA